MTREETKKIVRIMSTSYPNYKPSDLSDTIDIWTMMLEEYSYEQVAMALKAYIQTDTKGFAPAIGQIIDKIKSITTPMGINELQAWALVSKALRNGTYNSKEEFEKLPDLVRKTVGSADNLKNWATSDYTAIETVIQSNFIKAYKNIVEREKEISKFDFKTQNLISGINEHLCIESSSTGKIQSDRPISCEYVECDIPDNVVLMLKERGVNI